MSARESRLDIRTTQQTKEAIENAANAMGVTTSAFVIQSAMTHAVKVLENAQYIRLNEAESRRFLDLLDNPPGPNEKLKQLFADYGTKNTK